MEDSLAVGVSTAHTLWPIPPLEIHPAGVLTGVQDNMGVLIPVLVIVEEFENEMSINRGLVK